MQIQGTMQQWAFKYASKGYCVLPCRERGEGAKAPYTIHGEHDATTDRSTIKDWWDRTPHAMMGIATGPSGLCVIDCDRHHESVDGDKLWLVVTPSGSKTWRVFWKDEGTQKQYTIGSSPAISLKTARQQRDRINTLLANNLKEQSVRI